jgi:hypothetical protein
MSRVASKRNEMNLFQEKFFSNYEENLQTIFKMRDLTSGTHKINEERANLWINSQLSDRRKKAAYNLINNTHYVTFNEVFEGIRKLVNRVKHLSNPYLIVGKSNRSTYMMSIIFIYIWNLNDLGNINVIEKISDSNILGVIGKNPIILCDDIIYTGGQLNLILKEIMNHSYKRIVLGNYDVPNINIVILGATNFAINYYIDKIYNTLYEILPSQDYMDLLYYFAPMNFNGPVISLYLDHKISDPVSTFMKVLQYGPVLPRNLEYKDFILISMKEHIINKNVNINLEDYIENIHNNENEIINDKVIIDFIPFIEGCDNVPDIPLDMSYFSFIINKDVIEIIDSDPDEFPLSRFEYSNIHKFNKYYDVLDDPKNRCPRSWYKDKLLK